MFTFVKYSVQYYIFTQILSLDKNVIGNHIIGIRTIQDFKYLDTKYKG